MNEFDPVHTFKDADGNDVTVSEKFWHTQGPGGTEPVSEEILLLREIRDLLKGGKTP